MRKIIEVYADDDGRFHIHLECDGDIKDEPVKFASLLASLTNICIDSIAKRASSHYDPDGSVVVDEDQLSVVRPLTRKLMAEVFNIELWRGMVKGDQCAEFFHPIEEGEPKT